jgi:hypothetical protein
MARKINKAATTLAARNIAPSVHWPLMTLQMKQAAGRQSHAFTIPGRNSQCASDLPIVNMFGRNSARPDRLMPTGIMLQLGNVLLLPS